MANDAQPARLAPPAGAKSFDEAFQAASAEGPPPEGEDDRPQPAGAPPGSLPDWAQVPQDLKIPVGKEVAAMLFRAGWTDRRDIGDRQCILWPLSDLDERNAVKRTRGERDRGMSEMAKGCIRAIDGARIDWTRDPKALDRFWTEIGSKCRQMVINYYLKTHALDDAEQADFFENCFAVRTALPG